MGGASKFLMLLSTPFPLLYPRHSALRLARHSALRLARHSTAALASLYTTSSLPRRHCLASSRHRPGFSVRAAEGFHTQVGFREDNNGQWMESLPSGSLANSHPWPEWLKLVEHVAAGGYAERQGFSDVNGNDDDSFAGFEGVPVEFAKAVHACLVFARERPDLLRLLSKNDVEVVVENGSPFLFKNALNSASRRMRAFIGSEESSVLEYGRAETVDLMRYLLSYSFNCLVSYGENNCNAAEHVEASVRKLLSELVTASGTIQESYPTESAYRQAPFPRQNIEMKRGDWICPKCTFMNFAKNMKCRDCGEARPKLQLTGGEWECPQCDYFNYGRNMTCLRCDCKRPDGTVSTETPGASLGYDRNPSIDQIYGGSNSNKSEIERRLAENEEKAERWFSKVSQLGDSSDLSSAIADEDFPEIMPLRKGVNRFVVSTRKTPLERRLTNDQYKRNTVGDSSVEGETFAGGTSGIGSGKSTESSISRTLDRILGKPSPTAENDKGNNNQPTLRETNTGIRSRDPGSVPFVPFPADMFKNPQSSYAEGQSSENLSFTSSVNGSQRSDSISGITESAKSEKFPDLTGSKTDRELSDPSERWSNKGSELHDVKDSASSISDEDFPEIMPMRKGENRFVISKKKDRSLTSPQYKRRLAMEQANTSNFVPFVPFPPDYFAKKDKPTDDGNSTMKAETGSATSAVSENTQNVPQNSAGGKADTPNSVFLNADLQHGNQHTDRNSQNSVSSGRYWGSNKVDPVYGGGTGSTNNSWSNNRESWNNSRESWSSGLSPGSNLSGVNSTGSSAPPTWNNNRENSRSEFSNSFGSRGMNSTGSPSPPSWHNNVSRSGDFSSRSNSNGVNAAGKSTQQDEKSQNVRQGWGGGFSGTSLEGSAVTEPDPLDMSEEAKAQRWFRRVAQITDISELSKIPDEDFPEIMPMRKGVNRFVVSKRKTPLERRLTSPQYRRSLPIVSSEPEKDANQGNA